MLLPCLALLLSPTLFGSQRAYAQHSRASSDQTTSVQKRAAYPFRFTERLTYEAEFTRSLLRGINIAEFRFQLEERAPLTAPPAASQFASSERAETELVIRTEAVSKGFFKKLFSLNFRFEIESVVAPESFTLRSTRKFDEQGERLRTSEAVFDHAARRVTWTERNPKAAAREEPRVVTTDFGAIETPPQDLASVFYYLRTLPLKIGDSFELVLSDSGRVKRAPVETPFGKRPALELAIDLFGENRPAEGKGQMSVWLTDDERRLPVRARIRHDLGTLTIKLKRYHAG